MEIRSRPTLHDLITDLKSLVNKHAVDIEARVGQALTREQNGTNRSDGWPTKTTGSEGGGGKTKMSSVELAVTGKEKKDKHRELVFAAIDDVKKLYATLNSLIGRLDSIDDLAKIEVEAKLCEACTGQRSPEHKVDHRGTVGDRLTYVVDLCTDCYQFVLQSADAGSRQGRLPTERQIKDHEMRGRWKVRI